MARKEEFVSRIQDDLAHNRLTLPTLPEVALRARDAVEDPDCSAGKIAEIVASDAALSARLLQVANSALYRPRNPIDSLQMAVSRMGITTTRNLVTSLVMQQMFQATSDVLDTRLRRLWAHNVQVAAIARVLAAAFRHLTTEQAMLAGLIHDVGTLPILVAAEDEPDLLEDEQLLDEIIYENHTVIGKAILESWEFPETLVQVAAEHENLQRDPGGEVDYVDLVIVANLQSYIGTTHPLASADWDAIPAFNRVGIEPEINIVEVEGNAEQIDEVKQMFS